MNCKPGDLAFVKNQASPNYGRLVNVIRLLSDDELSSRGFYRESSVSWLVAAIGSPLVDDQWRLHAERPFADCSLHPIRPGESQEQSIEAMRLLTQLPQKEKA